MVQCDCIERPIRRFFYRYGCLVARHPFPFIIIPTVLALALATGFLFLQKNSDTEYLYSIEGSQVKKDRTLMEEFFKPDSEGYIQVTAVTRDPSRSIWSVETVTEILDIDAKIRNVLHDTKNQELRWSQVCQLKDQKCVVQPLLEMIEYNASLVPNLELRYPKHSININNNLKGPELFLPVILGGVEVKKDSSTVQTAQAMRLFYPLAVNVSGAIGWERRARGVILELVDDYDHVDISVTSSTTWGDELNKLPGRAMTPFTVTVLVLCAFAVLSCLSLNCVISKPWLGLSGIISSALAIGAGMGFLLFFLPFTDIVTAVPFLALGIGLDDMFVMIASWRKTSSELSIEQRMGAACSDAAVSITITTLTDVLAIGIGAVTNLPSVRMFCVFTAVCVFLDYVYIVTVFAGCMVYSGRREAAKRHACCTHVATIPASEAQSRACCFRICCTGGASARRPNSRKDRPEHAAMLFFRDTYGTFIMATPTKMAVGAAYGLYMAGAIWGCLNVKQGLEMTKTVADDSYATQDFANWDRYYRSYDLGADLVVYGELDYSNIDNQREIEQLTSRLENSKYFHDRTVTRSWIREFVQYAASRDIRYTEKNLRAVLDHWHQVEPSSMQYKDDIRWSNDGMKIVATRYTLYPKDQASPERKMAMQSEMTRIVDQSSLNATIVSPMSIFYEAWLAVMPNALQAFGTATAAVLIVCLLLIPNPVCSLYVALSIVSMCIGLVGYMSLWGVHVDAVSMVNIIMAVGFSVDFTAHITYAFTVASGETRQERVRKALYGLGVPIVQGSLSTIFGVLVLCVSFVYVLRVFFITIFLTMIFGALHGLVFIPVLLSLIGPIRPEKRRKVTPGSDLSHTTSSIKPVGVVKPMPQIKPELPPPREEKELEFKELDVDHLRSGAAYEEYLKNLSINTIPSVISTNSTIYLPRRDGYNKMPMRIMNPSFFRPQVNQFHFSKVDITYDSGDFVSKISTVTTE